MGEALVWSAIQTQLKGPENHFGFGGGTDAQQPEMVDGQVHQQIHHWLQTVDSVWGFAH